MAKTGHHLEDMIIGFDLPCSDSEYPNQVFLYTNNDGYKLDQNARELLQTYVPQHGICVRFRTGWLFSVLQHSSSVR